MKKIILASLLLALILPSCKRTKLEKPFIIIEKSYFQNPMEQTVYFQYTYQESSKNAVRITFTDVNNYEIGDTLSK